MDKDLLQRGLDTRKAVLGKEYVEKAMQSADDDPGPGKEYADGYDRGDICAGEALPRKTRSMLNLAMLTALNKPHELKLHIGGALTNGVTRAEIQEIFMQAAVYCGVPAGVEAFKIAREVFTELDKK